MKLVKLTLGILVFFGGLYSLFTGEFPAPDYVIFPLLAITFLLIGIDSLKEKSRVYGSLMLVVAIVMTLNTIKGIVNLIG